MGRVVAESSHHCALKPGKSTEMGGDTDSFTVVTNTRIPFSTTVALKFLTIKYKATTTDLA